MIATIPVAALMFLLVFGSSASAECAWVLWTESTPVPTRERRAGKELAGTFPTESACRAWIRQKADFVVSKSGTSAKVTETINGASITFSEKDTPYVIDHYSCLPDTVDPRGPKGGR